MTLKDDTPTPTPAKMTAGDLLALQTRAMSGGGVTEAERQIADGILLAAIFAAEAYDRQTVQEDATVALMRAFLKALVDPLSSDLDYLRADPASAEAARLEGRQ